MPRNKNHMKGAQGVWGPGFGDELPTPNPPPPSRVNSFLSVIPGFRSLSSVQRLLVVGIIAVTSMVLYGLLTSAGEGQGSGVRGQGSGVRPRTTNHEPRTSKTQPVFMEPASLKFADTLTRQGDFARAITIYERMLQNLPPAEDTESLNDFLILKIALCRKRAGDTEQANFTFKSLARSRSLVVRALAKYELSAAFLQGRHWLEAATRAFQVIAIVEAIDPGPEWLRRIRQDCWFIAAQAVTRNVLSLCDGDKELPPQLWPQPSSIDPFVDLTQDQLRDLLQSGSDKFNRAVLSPQVNRQRDPGAAARWLVVCDSAPIDELSARIAANADIDIRWPQTAETQSKEHQESLWSRLSESPGGSRERPVTCYLPSATAQQILTVAAGSVGLVARVNDEKSVTIYDPAEYVSLSDHTSLLAQHAISLWQRFILTFEQDYRIANAHFAVGLLHSRMNQLAEAIARFKLLVNRYSKGPLAPYALLHSSRAKVTLRDYFGAHEDLQHLVELYPDAEFSDQACIYLADAAVKAGMFAEAAAIYKKVFNMGLSAQWQLASAFGAGKCYFEQKDYNLASEWLTKYVTLAKDRTQSQFQEAALLLGQADLTLGKPQQALAALQLAAKTQLTDRQRAKVVCALVQAYTQQGNFVDAVELLESVRPLQLPQQEQVDLLLLKARTLCCLGLVDKAASILDKESQYFPDSQLRAGLAAELAKCYVLNQDFELAYKTLNETLTATGPGPLSQQICLDLAHVCLQLGRTAQAVALCCRLLEDNPPDDLKHKALDILAQAYGRQKNYNHAALALLGYNPQKTPPENSPTVPTNENRPTMKQTMQ